MKKLEEQVFWLYGVIVGLAIEKAVATTLQQVFPASFIAGGAENHATQALFGWAIRLEVLRLFVFLAMMMRFYLGSVTFFEKVYTTAEHRPSHVTFQLDFYSGFLHFLIFFAWSLTLASRDAVFTLDRFAVNPFLFFLGLLLLYDVPWLLIRSLTQRTGSVDDHGLIRRWTWRNILTVGWCAVLTAVTMYFSDAQASVLAEEIALWIVLIVSLADLRETLAEKEPHLTAWVIPF